MRGKGEKVSVDGESYWQRVFGQSKVNNAPYYGDLLPRWPAKWPTNTWLQKRLKQRAEKLELK